MISAGRASRRTNNLMHRLGEDNPRGPVEEGPSSPPPLTEQSFQVLTGRRDERLAVHFPQSPETETPQAVPVLRLGEERLDPDVALADRLLTDRGRVIAAHAIQVRLVEVPIDLASVGAGGAPGFE